MKNTITFKTDHKDRFWKTGELVAHHSDTDTYLVLENGKNTATRITRDDVEYTEENRFQLYWIERVLFDDLSNEGRIHPENGGFIKDIAFDAWKARVS